VNAADQASVLFKGNEGFAVHDELRASGGIARDVIRTAQRSRQRSQTAAGREHAAKQRAQTLTARTCDPQVA